ncbi:hypothetical protein GCM10009674_26300 [Nesterenkonia xinjiangensis]
MSQSPSESTGPELMSDESWPVTCPLHDDSPEAGSQASSVSQPLTILRGASDPRVKGLACPAGHRFDAAKQGYVNLLVGRGSSVTPDSPAMIMARERVQSAGVFSALTDALDQLAELWAPMRHTGGVEIMLDCGAGTGHHLQSLLDARPQARAVALDLSPAGLKRAARHPRTLALAWDLWRPLPVADGTVELLLDIFAPRNVDEYFRVLLPGAPAIVVTPRPAHLRELSGLGLLGMQPNKLADLRTQMHRRFLEPVEHRVVTAQVPVSGDSARDLVMMGPAGHHREADEVTARITEEGVDRVTVDLDVTVWRRPAGGRGSAHECDRGDGNP